MRFTRNQVVSAGMSVGLPQPVDTPSLLAVGLGVTLDGRPRIELQTARGPALFDQDAARDLAHLLEVAAGVIDELQTPRKVRDVSHNE